MEKCKNVCKTEIEKCNSTIFIKERTWCEGKCLFPDLPEKLIAAAADQDIKCLLKDWCKERREFMKEIKKLKLKIKKLENG